MSRSSPIQVAVSRCEPLERRRLLSVNVTTYHYDNARSGANTNETTLTLSNVNENTFGKLASLPVDGQVYGQPLIMTGIAVPGQGTHDIVLVATENDTVYAFDAYGNNPAAGYLWKTSLLQNGETPVPESSYGTTDITPVVGVTGTPVIDASTGTLYVVGLFKETNSTYVQRLYALNIANGANKFGGPVTINASVSGSGSGSSGGTLAFSAFRENQRPALTLANGEVYVAWASHGDQSPWHGWIIAYNASSLHQDYVYNTTPNGDAGGIWMSGGGLAVDSNGDLYFTTGNGTFDANTGGEDYSMAIEKLSPSLQPLDYFAPDNQAALSNVDLDYGCSNAIILPNQGGSAPNEVLTAGKWGTLYLNNSNTGSLGEFNSNSNDDLSEANITSNVNQTNLRNTISYWNGHVYIGGNQLALKGYNIGGGSITTTSFSQSSNVFGVSRTGDGQGTAPTISSNGTSNGIVWALDDSGFAGSAAILYAYNANNLGQMLWNSSQAPNNEDIAGNAVKFQSPVVANGHVYVGGANSVTVYGLLPTTPTLVTPATAAPSPVTGTTTQLTVAANGPRQGQAITYAWSTTSLPAGAATPDFNSTTVTNPTVTFHATGAYTFSVTITNPTTSQFITSSVNVTVNSGVASISLSPTGPVTLTNGLTAQFTPVCVDQFGQTISPAPTLTWTVSNGIGSVNSSGLYQAPAIGAGSATVQAASGNVTAQSSVLVQLPTWLGANSAAGWDSATGILSVTGAASIMSDPGSDQPIIQANVSHAVVTIDTTNSPIVHIGGLNLSGGAIATLTSLGTAPATATHGVLVLGLNGAANAPTLAIDSASKLDLTDNDLIVHAGNFPAVNAALQAGYNADAWNGSGIVSSACPAGSSLTLGDGTASSSGTFDGESVTASDTEVRFTVDDDATFDGTVDDDDYSRIDNGFTNHLAGYSNGDFNYDGVVNGSDFTLIDNVYTAAGDPTSQIAKSPSSTAPQTKVPAPASATAVPAKPAAVVSRFSSVELSAASFQTSADKPPAPLPRPVESAFISRHRSIHPTKPATGLDEVGLQV